jgi:hypothetical protein
MAEKNNLFRGTKTLVSLAALVIIIAGVNLAQSVVVLFLVSFAIVIDIFIFGI